MTGVNKYRNYSVYLDNGVRLTISLADSRNGPSVQASFDPDSAAPYRVQLPGGIVAISAPSAGVDGMTWAKVAEALRVPLILPEKEPEPEKPKPQPFDQCEIPL
jgi:hypothetical protein